MWAKVSRAYEVLSDPKQKQRYDMFGEEGVQSAAGQSGGGGQQVDLSDIFDSFFGGMGGSPFGAQGGAGTAGRRRGPMKGDDLRFDLEIDFKMACFGGKEKIR